MLIMYSCTYENLTLESIVKKKQILLQPIYISSVSLREYI